MGLIVNSTNPWGGSEGHAYVSSKIVRAVGEDVKGDEFYIVSTPESEEERNLCFVAKDKQGAHVLLATLDSITYQLKKLLEQEG